MPLLFTGLGNPGSEYAKTRHNIGFRVLDAFASKRSLTWKEAFGGLYTDCVIGSQKVFLLKPMTYMNLSGNSVAPFCAYYKIKPEELIVTHDELDFPFGKVKLLKGGSAAGHNGVTSVSGMMGTQDYFRLRMGVAGIPRGEMRGHSAQYVLANFTKTEEEALPELINNAVEALEYIAENGFVKTMNLFNRK